MRLTDKSTRGPSDERRERRRITTLLNFERVLWTAGIERVAGVDEVGLGPLAGPVVAAAVILPRDIDLAEVDDSKRLDDATRQRLAPEIAKRAVALAVAEVKVAELSHMNTYQAGLEALRRAVTALPLAPQHLLSDARVVPGLGELPQNAFEKGDSLSYSIACASIVAKVHRDRLMTELARHHPGYGFEIHKGYGTPEHMRALRELGPCAEHRTSWAALGEIMGAAHPSFYSIRDAIDAAVSAAGLAEAGARLDAATALAPGESKKLRARLARRRRALSAAARRPRA